MSGSGPRRRDVLIATAGFLTFAGCTNSTAAETGYGATYGAGYGTE